MNELINEILNFIAFVILSGTGLVIYMGVKDAKNNTKRSRKNDGQRA